MSGMNLLAVVAAAVIALLQSAIWNRFLFGDAIMQLRDPGWDPSADAGAPPLWKLLVEVVRSLVVAFVLAYLIVQLDISTLSEALQFGLLVWIGFPATILAGTGLLEDDPVQLMAIRVGDWLVKLILMTVVLGLWR